MTETQGIVPVLAARPWHTGLWIAQAALAAIYIMAAYMHGIMSVDALVAMGAVWTEHAPIALVRFIGLMELLGALGLILPGLTGIKPHLTVWAAAGLLAIQVLAIPFHMIRGEFVVLPANAVYVALCLLVLWGRARKLPLAPRSA